MTKEEEKYCLQELSYGNRHAFERLFLEWYPHLVDFFNRVLSDGGGYDNCASDYAQDVFFDVWMSRKKFADVNSFSAYLFQMARHKVYNHYDKLAVKSRFRREAAITGSDVCPSDEGAIYAQEKEAQMLNKLRILPKKRRMVFIMSRLLGFTNQQISIELGISKRTVENHITSVLAFLRKDLNG